MPGYSQTPLAKKLGIKSGTKLLLLSAPDDYPELLQPVPEHVTLVRRFTTDISGAHVFARSASRLRAQLRRLRATLHPNAFVWVSWPKKSSKVPTDITEDTIRDIALPLGFVDIKVCAVSEVWSALKLVVRRELR